MPVAPETHLTGDDLRVSVATEQPPAAPAQKQAWVEGHKSSTNSKNVNSLEVSIRFRPFAWAALSGFLLTTVLGAIVTFTATEYDKETDLIFRFYDTFNPCIVWDHNPANVVTAITTSLWAAASAGLIFLMLSWVWVANDLALSFITFGLLSLHYLFTITVSNIYTASLYPDGEPASPPAAGEPALTNTELINTLTHTVWYLLYLLGHTLGCIATGRVLRWQQGGTLRWSQTLLLFACEAILMLGLAAVLAYMGTYERTPAPSRARASDDPDTFVQEVLNFLAGTIELGLWHWIPLFVYPFMLTGGVTFKLSLTRDPLLSLPASQFRIDPERIVTLMTKVLAFLMFGSFIFEDPEKEGDLHLALLSGFRKKPFNFLVAPMWMFLTHVLAMAVLLFIARTMLMQKGRWELPQAKLQAISGLALVLAFVCGVWMVLPDFDTKGIPAMFVLVLLPLFFQVSYGLAWQVLAFNAVWLLCGLLAAALSGTASTVFNALLVLVAYGFAHVTDTLGLPDLRVSVSHTPSK